MSEKLSFKLASGKTFSGQFEVKNGIVTVTTSDGRTRSAAIEDSMLDAETLAKTLLFQLREDERRAESIVMTASRPALTKLWSRSGPRRLVLVQSPSIAVALQLLNRAIGNGMPLFFGQSLAEAAHDLLCAPQREGNGERERLTAGFEHENKLRTFARAVKPLGIARGITTIPKPSRLVAQAAAAADHSEGDGYRDARRRAGVDGTFAGRSSGAASLAPRRQRTHQGHYRRRSGRCLDRTTVGADAGGRRVPSAVTPRHFGRLRSSTR